MIVTEYPTYCDDCGTKIWTLTTSIVIPELPFDISSANESESAVICPACLQKHNYNYCLQCRRLVEMDDAVSTWCESCHEFYHKTCRPQYHMFDILVCFNCFEAARPPKGGTKP